MQAKTIALLGGTGFVGSTLASQLTAAGWRVRILTRHPQRHREFLVVPQIRLLKVDVLSLTALADALSGRDAVVNLVGVLNSRGRNGRDFDRLHASLPGRVARVCREGGVPRLLHMSALHADADNGVSHYLRSKGAGEAAVRREAGGDVAVTIFQPSVIYGANDSFVNRFAGLLKLPSPFIPLPKPNARFAPAYVGDVAAAMVKTLEDKGSFGKSYQLCGSQVMSLREIVELIAKTIDVRKPVLGLPDTLAKIQAFLMEFVPGKPLSRDNLRSLEINSICDSNGFEKLGLPSRSAETWIPRVLGGKIPGASLDDFRRVAGR